MLTLPGSAGLSPAAILDSREGGSPFGLPTHQNKVKHTKTKQG